MLFSLANFEVKIFPSAPLDPNPPGNKIPSIFLKEIEEIHLSDTNPCV